MGYRLEKDCIFLPYFTSWLTRPAINAKYSILFYDSDIYTIYFKFLECKKKCTKTLIFKIHFKLG